MPDNNQNPAPAPAAAPQEGFLHSLATSMGLDPEAIRDTAKAIMANPRVALSEVGSEASDEVKQAIQNWDSTASQTGQGLVDTITNPEAQKVAKQRWNKPGVMNKVAGAEEYLTSGVPMVGGNLVKAEEQGAEGNAAGAAGTTLGTVAPLLEGAAKPTPEEFHPYQPAHLTFDSVGGKEVSAPENLPSSKPRAAEPLAEAPPATDYEKEARIEELQKLVRSPNQIESKSARQILGTVYGVQPEPEFQKTLGSRSQLPGQTVDLSPAYGDTGSYVGHQLEARNALAPVEKKQAYISKLGNTTGTEPLPIPQHMLEHGQTTPSIVSHELGHILEIDRQGAKWGTGVDKQPLEIYSHTHPDADGAVAAVAMPWSKVPGSEIGPNGEYGFRASNLPAVISDLIHVNAAGGVMQELTHNVPFLAGTKGDMDEIFRMSKAAGFTKEETYDMVNAARNNLKQEWNKPEILDLLRGASAGREEGLSKTLHMSADRVQAIRDQVRQLREETPNGKENSNPAANAGAGVPVAAEPGAAAAGRSAQAGVREGDGQTVPGRLVAARKVGPPAPLGMHEDDLPREADYQSVDFNAPDLQDTGKRVTPETIKQDYAPRTKAGQNASVYQSYIPMEDLPSPKFVTDEEENFDRADYNNVRSGSPIKVLVKKDGSVHLLDGNHRMQVWGEQDKTHAPAWVIDERHPGIENIPESEREERAQTAQSQQYYTPKGAKDLADHIGGKVVGSVGKSDAPNDLDLRHKNYDADTIESKMAERGFDHYGSSLVSPKEAQQSGKPYAPGWQRAEHFEHPGGAKVDVWHDEPMAYSHAASDFVDKDYLPEGGTDGLFHVTTAKDKVMAEGLKSRKETGSVGLGGGVQNAAPSKVSVTFDEGHANQISDRMQLAIRAAKGEVEPDEVLNRITQDAGLADDEPHEIAQALHAPEDTYEDWDKFNDWFHENYKKEDSYELLQDLDDALPRIFEGEGSPVRVGFTASKEQMAKLDPEQVGILPVEARIGAKTEHVPEEAELRFAPEDLRVKKEEMPTIAHGDPDEFSRAVENTKGATRDGKTLTVRAERYQKPEQAGEPSIRTGVFYSPEPGSPYSRYYKAGKMGYGGTQRVEGDITFKNPIVAKGASGGKVPERAYDAILGKGSYEKMRRDVLDNMPRTYYGVSHADAVDRVGELLQKYGANPETAASIIEHSKMGNTLPYAIQENIVAHALRAAGHDGIVGYSKIKGQPRLSEVFHITQNNYPTGGTVLGLAGLVAGYTLLHHDAQTE